MYKTLITVVFSVHHLLCLYYPSTSSALLLQSQLAQSSFVMALQPTLTTRKSTEINDLPTELLIQIFTKLELEDFFYLIRTISRFRSISRTMLLLYATMSFDTDTLVLLTLLEQILSTVGVFPAMVI